METKKLTINVTAEQNKALDWWSERTGVTKNGLICLAIDTWLNERNPNRRYIPSRYLTSDIDK